MRRPSQGLLRVSRLVLAVLGALACGEDPAPPAGQAPAALLPDWAQHLCESWRRRDGSCDQTTLIADYEECLRTKGVPELERLRKAGVGNRMQQIGREQATNLCLELRHWVMTEAGRAQQLGPAKRPPRPS